MPLVVDQLNGQEGYLRYFNPVGVQESGSIGLGERALNDLVPPVGVGRDCAFSVMTARGPKSSACAMTFK